jgi:hypothetical protein
MWDIAPEFGALLVFAEHRLVVYLTLVRALVGGVDSNPIGPGDSG